jgi:hypothetical protein
MIFLHNAFATYPLDSLKLAFAFPGTANVVGMYDVAARTTQRVNVTQFVVRDRQPVSSGFFFPGRPALVLLPYQLCLRTGRHDIRRRNPGGGGFEQYQQIRVVHDDRSTVLWQQTPADIAWSNTLPSGRSGRFAIT